MPSIAFYSFRSESNPRIFDGLRNAKKLSKILKTISGSQVSIIVGQADLGELFLFGGLPSSNGNCVDLGENSKIYVLRQPDLERYRNLIL